MTTSRVSLRLRRGNFFLMTLVLAGTVATSSAPARGQDPPPAPRSRGRQRSRAARGTGRCW